MPKPRRLFILTLFIFFGVLLAKLPKTFTTTSQKTRVTITIHPNEDSDDQGEDNNDQGDDNQNDQSNFNFFSWLKSLFS